MTTWDMTVEVAITTGVVMALWFLAVSLIERSEKRRRDKQG